MSITKRMQALLNKPPGLPHPRPTVSAWQEPRHPTVGATQSSKLPSEVDVAIIGSGVTGCGVAYTLLNHPNASKLRVIILEAREAVSGATGRNGGHLVSNADDLFPPVAEAMGMEEAKSVAHLSERTIARLKEIVAGLSKEDQTAVELRCLASTIVFEDMDTFREAQQAIEFVQQNKDQSAYALPETMVSVEHAIEKWKYTSNIVGAAQQTGAAALWPYRLFTALYKILLEQNPGRFTLETNTPVTSIIHDSKAAKDNAAYLLQTPRGSIRTRHVIHCTNGHAGHLIPGLVGKLWPVRATMSHQKMGPSFPQLGGQFSWTYRNKPSLDPSTGITDIGLYYAQQNARTGDLWIGGEVQKIDEMLSADDSVVSELAKRNLCSVVPKILHGSGPVEPISVWSGIMGFTADGLPLVGQLPPAFTERAGGGEWIAGGYNGHGMDKAWSCGEAVAQMILGEQPPSWMPKSFLLGEGRLKLIIEQNEQSLPSMFLERMGILHGDSTDSLMSRL
ncbi:uncharacterized protein N7484_005064 [Penicillium longicatenatum]|uniref:uncharacterized protein n=1 Tax=Penicillium longicatenatum TaxID=1561947 RepID=UPI0025485C1E|nr:uncharacterized protein N7484_005064 [Penicillium longicatenatum]KAJ5651341.1 hypothetical protein N7484_005064 [Penicillium longicatenatum]